MLYSLTSTLPVELINDIVDRVPSSSTELRSLRAVNRQFYKLATPRAFQEVMIANSIKGAKSLKCFQETESISPFIEELILDGRYLRNFDVGPYRLDYNYNEFEMKRMKGLLESALTQIHQLPNLKGLRLHFWPSWKDLSSATVEEHGASFLSRQMTLLDALRNSEPPPSLKSLSITNLCLLHRHPERRGGAQRSFFSQLSEITITVLSSAEHGLVAATHSGNRPIVYGPRDYLPQSHSHLTSLTLRSPRGIFHTHDLCPHGIYYPRLNTLSLENIVLGRPSSPGSMISFILSHKLTLQKLELFSCSVIVTGDPDEALGSWSQILNRFSKDLKVLREINIVAGSQENAKVGMAYTMFVENKELEAYLSSAQRVKADNLSLERIRYVVDTRRAMRRM